MRRVVAAGVLLVDGVGDLGHGVDRRRALGDVQRRGILPGGLDHVDVVPERPCVGIERQRIGLALVLGLRPREREVLAGRAGDGVGQRGQHALGGALRDGEPVGHVDVRRHAATDRGQQLRDVGLGARHDRHLHADVGVGGVERFDDVGEHVRIGRRVARPELDHLGSGRAGGTGHRCRLGAGARGLRCRGRGRGGGGGGCRRRRKQARRRRGRYLQCWNYRRPGRRPSSRPGPPSGIVRVPDSWLLLSVLTSGRPRVSGPTATSSRPLDPVSRWPFPAQLNGSVSVASTPCGAMIGALLCSSGAGASPTPCRTAPTRCIAHANSTRQAKSSTLSMTGSDVLGSRIRAWPSIDAAISSTHNRRTMSHTTNGRGRTPVSDDRRPTMHDVADLAGVSLKTVSRVFNHEPNVRPAVRARVESAAISLGFRRNIIAKNLRTGSATSSVGLVIADLLNPFYGAIAMAVEAVANRHSATMILGSSAEDVIREQRIVTDLLEGHVDGLIVVPTGGDHSYLEPQRRLGRPRRLRRPAGQRHRGRRGRPRQRRRRAIGDAAPAEPWPSPDRLRRRLGDPGDGAGAPGRLSAGPRRGRRRVRSGARPVRCPADRAGRDRRPAAARERRPADGDLRREQPQLHRGHPGAERDRPTGRRRRLRRLRAGRPARITGDRRRLRPGRARPGRRRAPVREDGRRPPAAPADRHPDPARRPRLGRAPGRPDRSPLTGSPPRRRAEATAARRPAGAPGPRSAGEPDPGPSGSGADGRP